MSHLRLVKTGGTDMADDYRNVADDLKRRAHTLRVEGQRLAPKDKNRLRMRAAKLDRAARLLIEIADEDELGS